MPLKKFAAKQMVIYIRFFTTFDRNMLVGSALSVLGVFARAKSFMQTSALLILKTLNLLVACNAVGLVGLSLLLTEKNTCE